MPLLPASKNQNSQIQNPQKEDAETKKFAALWSLLPPLTLFGIAFALTDFPLPKPVGIKTPTDKTFAASAQAATDWVVPAAETMIVSRQAASGYAVLRGRLRLANGQTVVAPSRGQIARVMARVGQSVKAGEPLLLISRGTIDAPRSTSPLENWQNQAEDAQIAAAKQQESLENRMSSANERLQKAQARVAAAQQRVTDARALVRRLQNGEEVGSNEVHTSTPTPQPSPRAADDSSQSEARAAALRESQRLGKSADVAEAKAKATNRAAREADGAVREKQNKLESALAALAAVKASVKPQPDKAATDGNGIEKIPADVELSTPDTSAETKAVAAARGEVAAANARTVELRREAAQLQSRAVALRKNANDSARRAMQSLQVFDGEAAPSSKVVRIAKDGTVSKSSSANGGSKITISDAARIARNAMQESDEAIADAVRIRKEVAGYGDPVAGTKRRFDNATRRLQDAQQQIWNSAGASRPNITSVGAPASGVILWVTEIAREVRIGETVAGIGQPNQLEVVIEDSSGAWKSLQPGARVLALVKNMDGSTPALARPTSATQNPPPTINGTPTLARVLAIAPPLKADAPARIRISVYNPPKSGGYNRNRFAPRAFAPGMGVLFSLARPGKGLMMRVPAASIRRNQENGKNFVAVLSPVPSDPSDQLTSACRVEWREVQVGAGDGFYNRVLAGLEPGERVALRPQALYNFTTAYGAQATVHVEQT